MILAAIALVHVLQLDHVLAGARRRREIERDGLAALRRLDPLDLVQLLDPALHLRGVRGARLEALDEVDFLGQHRLLALELRLLLLFVQRALLLVEFVIAGIGGQADRRRSRRSLLTMRFMNSRSCEVISSAPS